MNTRLDRTMLYAAYAYIVLPYIIFALGWYRWYYGVAISLLVIVSTVLSLRRHVDLKSVDLKKHTKRIGIVLLVILAWVYFSGIGGYSYQRQDQLFRNAIFHDLISHSWPVLYNNTNWHDASGLASSHIFVMTYYTGYWLPAAIAGKLFGWAIGNFFLYLWTVAGLVLIYYFICRFLGAFSLRILWMFIFLGTLYYLGTFARLPIKTVLAIDYFNWSGTMMYADSTTEMFYEVFNQCITPWLIFILILNNLPKQNLLFIYAFCFFQGPFPFLGLFPFVAYFSFKDIFAKGEPANFLKRIYPYCSFQGIIGVLFILLPVYFYFSGNIAAQKFAFAHISAFKFAQVAMLSFGVLAAIMFYKYKKEPLYYISIIILLIVPFFRLGTGMDVCGRVSIPAVFLLMLLGMRFVLEEKNKTPKTIMVVYLIFAAYGPASAIVNSAIFKVGSCTDPVATNVRIYNRECGYLLWTKEYINNIPEELKHKNLLLKDNVKSLNEFDQYNGQNFIGNTDKSIFYKYLAKRD